MSKTATSRFVIVTDRRNAMLAEDAQAMEPGQRVSTARLRKAARLLTQAHDLIGTGEVDL